MVSVHSFGGEATEKNELTPFSPTVKFAGAVYVLHAFQKKPKKGLKTPRAELDLIRKRLKAAEEHYGEWRATQEDAEGDEAGAGSRGE